MCTTYSGAIIRTTHVTGTVTDIGLIIGQAVFHKRTRKHLWKLKILVPLYLSFVSGAIIGWCAFQLLRNRAMLVPCAIIGCLSLGHTAYCRIFLNLDIHTKVPHIPEETDDSAELSVVPPDTVVESSKTIDKHSFGTDRHDDARTTLEHCLDFQGLITPLITATTRLDVDAAKLTELTALNLVT